MVFVFSFLVFAAAVSAVAIPSFLTCGLNASLVRVVALSAEDRRALGHFAFHSLRAAQSVQPNTVLGQLRVVSPSQATTLVGVSELQSFPVAQQFMYALLSNQWPELTRELTALSPPVMWTAEEISELKGTLLWTPVRNAFSALKQRHRNSTVAFVAAHQLQGNFTFAAWKWAYGAVKALQFFSSVKKTMVLIPQLSLFSFGGPGNAHLHERSDGVIEMRARSAIKEGEIVRFNDDLDSFEADNHRLLEMYGLLLSKRKFTYRLSVVLADREDPMFGNKRELFDRYFPEKKLQHDFALDGESIPEGLLFALRVYHAVTSEVNEVQEALHGRPVSVRNEKQVWENLGQVLASRLYAFPTTLEEDGELLKNNDMPRAAKNAILLRRAEKRILRKTLRLIDEAGRALHNKFMRREYDGVKITDENVMKVG